MSPLMLVLVIVCAEAAPIKLNRPDLEPLIDDFLEVLYEKVHPQEEVDIYDQMQGDQPDNNINPDFSKFLSENFSTNGNMSDYSRISRNRLREVDNDDRVKDKWMEAIKEKILRQIGRSNTTTKIEDIRKPMNSSMSFLSNSTLIDDDQIAEKIRSYYPSCDVPTNMEQEIWKDENIMNLNFNHFDQTDEKGMSIATATLRLYRLPSDNTTKIGKVDCENGNSTEEEKLMRVSIYWYTRSVRKKKIKKRLSDSKMMNENSKWVELSVKPATRSWSRGRNMGLAVQVEDQEGNVLKADKYFKGALCMVGASTPKPIPTIIVDAAQRSNEFDQRLLSILRGNSTASLSGDVSMLPTIDVCTLEFPDNYTHLSAHIDSLRVNACNLKKSHERVQMLAERDRVERLATLPELLSPRHIRHQRQHLKIDFDPRSKIENARILTSDAEVQMLTRNLTMSVDR